MRTRWLECILMALFAAGVLAAGAASATKPEPPEIRVVVYDAAWCKYCQPWLADAKAAGLPVTVRHYKDLTTRQQRRIGPVPAVYLWVGQHRAARIEVKRWYRKRESVEEIR